MALLAGPVMAVLGPLKLGKVVNFVSNSVMTGFVMGVAVLIMVGKFDEIFGYDPTTYSNKVAKAIDVLSHPGSWDLTTTCRRLGDHRARVRPEAGSQLERYALVLVVFVVTGVVWVLSIDTPVISDTAHPDRPVCTAHPDRHVHAAGSLDDPEPPRRFDLDRHRGPGPGAGIRPAFPNPDGSRASASRDSWAGPRQRRGRLLPGGAIRRIAVADRRQRRWWRATARVAGYVAAAWSCWSSSSAGRGRDPQCHLGACSS